MLLFIWFRNDPVVEPSFEQFTYTAAYVRTFIEKKKGVSLYAIIRNSSKEFDLQDKRCKESNESVNF